MSIKSVIKFVPHIIEYLPAVVALWTAIKCKWYVKLLIFTVIAAVASLLIAAGFFPYSVDPVHPIDTAERLAKEATSQMSQILQWGK